MNDAETVFEGICVIFCHFCCKVTIIFGVFVIN